MRMNPALAKAGLILLWFCSSVPARPDSPGFSLKPDVAFLGPDRAEKLDVYFPSQKFARPLPAVIWIHGGAWYKGDKANGRERNVCGTLAANGYVAFSINYLLGKPKDGDNLASEEAAKGREADRPAVPWPQNFYDCKSALRYVRAHAAEFGVDPNRIAVAGGSAGGHLALMVGTTGQDAELNQGGLYLDQGNEVACIVDFYGAPWIELERRIRYFAGSTPEETEANLKVAAPINHLRPDTPPVLIVHGTKDPAVPLSMSETLAKRLEENRIPYEFVRVPDAGHAFHLQPEQMDLRPAVLAFLEKYLGKPEPVSAGTAGPER